MTCLVAFALHGPVWFFRFSPSTRWFEKLRHFRALDGDLHPNFSCASTLTLLLGQQSEVESINLMPEKN
jgi:hypothetical protein